jgi:hypothetical protein
VTFLTPGSNQGGQSGLYKTGVRVHFSIEPNALGFGKLHSDPVSSFGFPFSSVSGIVSPIDRSAPEFIGGGRTLGGAPELVIPNGMTPEVATVTEVSGMMAEPS